MKCCTQGFLDIASHPPCEQKSAFKRRCISVIARKLVKTGIVRSFAIVSRAPCSLTSGAPPGIDAQIVVCIQRSNAHRDICKHKMQNQVLRQTYNFWCTDKLQLMTYSHTTTSLSAVGRHVPLVLHFSRTSTRNNTIPQEDSTLSTLAAIHRFFVCGHFSSACFEERQPVKNKQCNALERTKTPKSIACERWVNVLVVLHPCPDESELYSRMCASRARCSFSWELTISFEDSCRAYHTRVR